MRNKKKLTSLMLTAAMITTMVAGCGGNNNTPANTTTPAPTTTASGSNNATTPAATTTAASTEVAKPDSIHWMVHDGMSEENGTAQWVEEFERLTGIDLNLEIVSNNEYNTILELAFASGSVPDVFDLNGEQKLSVYAKQKAIYDMTSLIESSDLYEKVDPQLWEALRINGNLYGVPKEVASGAVTYIRKDWLDRLNMKVPTNYQEFTDMLRAFKDNIEECTVPLTSPGVFNTQNLPEFYQDAATDFVKVNGEWIDGFAQENMVGAMTRLHDAYAEGLIDLEVITNTTGVCRDQWYGGSVGVFNYWGGNWGQTLTERLQVNVPEADVLAMDPIEGATYLFSVPSVLVMSNKIDDDRAASIYKYFFEYMHDGGEGQVLFQSGVENLHWKQEGNNLVPLPSLSKPEETLRKAWITPWMCISPLEVTDKNQELHPACVDSLAVINKFGVQKPAFPVSDTLNKISADLKIIREEILAKVLVGDMTVEEGMAKYKENAEMLNVQKVVDELNGK